MTLVLLYHGVTARSISCVGSGLENYNSKHINVEYFYNQLKQLSRRCSFYSIDDLRDSWIRKRNLPDNSIVVTFDDGFLNNYITAAPILTELDIPAVFYISTGNIDESKMFWVDELEILFNSNISKCIEISKDSDLHELFKSSHGNSDLYKIDLRDTEQSIKLLNRIKTILKLKRPKLRAEIIKEISLLFGQPMMKFNNSYADFGDYCLMNWNQVKK